MSYRAGGTTVLTVTAVLSIALGGGSAAATVSKGPRSITLTHPAAAAGPASAGAKIAAAPAGTEYHLDLGRLGIKLAASPLPIVGAPKAGAKSNAAHTAFMSVEPGLAQQSTNTA